MQGARSAVIGALTLVIEKLAIELKTQTQTRSQNIVKIAIFNVRTLYTINQLLELTVSSTDHGRDVICMQEHRYYFCELEIKYRDTGKWWIFFSASAWQNSVNAVIGCVGMHLSPRALKSLNNIEKIHPRIICALSNANPITTIVSCYSPINASEEIDIITFYGEPSVKPNILIISIDTNTQIGKDE